MTVPLRNMFVERDSRALGFIRTRLSPRLVTKYTSYMASKALWDALKTDFSTTNKTELAFAALTSLHTVKLCRPDGAKNVTFSVMEKHIDRVAGLFDTLEKLKFSISEELQPLYLLRTLPRDHGGLFDNLRASITGSVSLTALTLEVVENKLLAHADRNPEDANSSNSETDMAANTAQAAHPSTSPGCYCHYHKSNTHNTEDCKVLKSAEQQGKGKKGKKVKDARVPKKDRVNSANDSNSDSSESAHVPVAIVSSEIYKKISAYVTRDSTSTRSFVLINSGASCTMTYDTHFFETGSLHQLNPPCRVRLGDNSACDASAIGTMRLSCKTSQGPADLAILGTLLVPDFTVTLVSVPQLASKQLSSHFVGDRCVVRNDRTQETVLEASCQHGLYHISCQPLGMDAQAHFAMDINSVHRKLGHTNFQSI
ncbi:Retrovirus-related Pol polyprotein from transposon TNT 1-94 [Mycena venus]|uniref:Retrovirus-related Pol polyprotein from transposon TNT 1-94 n=1 Tax=Mycena venus TaxID=2733690 RepID=A0A8H6X3Y0_9AGAR|nr:Retrovirus-related Pol polyprotein from transposon TNT 1-94 [Mycena venus]